MRDSPYGTASPKASPRRWCGSRRVILGVNIGADDAILYMRAQINYFRIRCFLDWGPYGISPYLTRA